MHRLLRALLALWLGLAACSFPEVTIVEETMVDDAECAESAECPASAEACEQAICENGACVFAAAMPESVCTRTDGSPGVCATDMTCVQCTDDTPCQDTSLECVDGFCSPNHCTTPDPGDETDDNCGGSCPPCGVGRGCMVAGDCVSGVCTEETCAGCVDEMDCDAGLFCDDISGECRAPLADGVSCTQDNQCVSGHCAAEDGVCCNDACDGKCESCKGIDTDMPTGQCEPVRAGIDDEQCTLLGLGTCDGNRECSLF